MASSYHVDVRLLHQFHITHHRLPVHMFACAWMLLVPVYPFKFHSFSVDGEQVAMHLHFSHSKTGMDGLNNFIVIVFEIQMEIV